MPLGKQVGPGHIIRWGPSGDPATHSSPSLLSAHAYCGQTVADLSNCCAIVRYSLESMIFQWRCLWNCTRTHNSEFFDSIDADSSDVEFQQIITFGCLSSLLTWVKITHLLCYAIVNACKFCIYCWQHKCPTEIFHSWIYFSSLAVLTNAIFLPVWDSKLSKRRAVSLL